LTEEGPDRTLWRPRVTGDHGPVLRTDYGMNEYSQVRPERVNKWPSSMTDMWWWRWWWWWWIFTDCCPRDWGSIDGRVKYLNIHYLSNRNQVWAPQGEADLTRSSPPLSGTIGENP
jgi:hypothetical protein